jgi:hypothetical protein
MLTAGWIGLLLDSYSARKCEEVRRVAERLMIDLVFVPAGCTDSGQPCDRYVLGAFKALLAPLLCCEVDCPSSEAEFVSMVIRSWAARPKSALGKAWAHFRSWWR